MKNLASRVNQRIALLLIIAVFWVPLAGITLYPRTANAQVGCAAAKIISDLKGKVTEAKGQAYPGFYTHDAGAISVQAKTASEASFQNTVSCILDGLAWTVAKTAIQSMTHSIVNWINSGFQGSPAFVTDLNQSLGNLADSVANDFLNGLNQVVSSNTPFNLRSPFQDQIAGALREEYYRTTSSYGFDVRNPYTLGTCSQNPTAFTQGSQFSEGGFNAFFCASQNPANNPYGRYQLARSELFSTLDNQVQNQITELGWGRGFLSWRGPCGQNANKNAAKADLGSKNTSTGCSIQTPGAVVENQLENALGSPIRQLELADSVNEIVGALMSQMVNQVLGGGGLAGVSQPSAGGGSSYLSQATNPNQYSGVVSNLAQGFSTSITQQRQNVQDYVDANQKIADAAAAAKNACVSDSSKAAQANSVLSAANAAVQKGTAALPKIDALQAQAASAQRGSATDADVTAVLGSFQTIFSSTDVPTPDETDQSKMDADDTNPASLYSQMTALKASCGG